MYEEARMVVYCNTDTKAKNVTCYFFMKVSFNIRDHTTMKSIMRCIKNPIKSMWWNIKSPVVPGTHFINLRSMKG